MRKLVFAHQKEKSRSICRLIVMFFFCFSFNLVFNSIYVIEESHFSSIVYILLSHNVFFVYFGLTIRWETYYKSIWFFSFLSKMGKIYDDDLTFCNVWMLKISNNKKLNARLYKCLPVPAAHHRAVAPGTMCPSNLTGHRFSMSGLNWVNNIFTTL